MSRKGEEEAIDDRKMDKKMKSKSKKGETREHGGKTMLEMERGDNDIIEMKMQKKKDRGKKNDEVTGDTGEGDANKDLNCVYEEDSNGVGGIDNVVRKKRKKEKNKRGDGARMIVEPEVGSAKEVDKNCERERSKKESVSRMKSNEGALEEEKIQNESSSCKGAAEKKKRKRQKKLDKSDDCFGRVGNEDSSGEILETFNEGQNDNLAEKVKKKKKKNVAGSKDDEGVFSVPPTLPGENATSKLDKKKKSKKITNLKDVAAVAHQDFFVQDSVDKNFNSHLNTDAPINKVVEFAKRKKKKKKAKSVESVSEDPTPSKTNKKVRFSGEVEVLPPRKVSNIGNIGENNLVRGKRFTKEEDEIVKEAVWNYIAERELGDEGLHMVINCRKHPQLKGCWNEIQSAIPYRPCKAVYDRAQILFRRSEERKWNEEEYKMVMEFQKVHGNKWTELADELGKHRVHVRDAWRRVKFPNLKKGHWSQKEYQQLFNLVNADLQQKVSEEKKLKHGMLRDNISWTAISDQLSTRYGARCCAKWYKQLTSPMVAQGVWADADDYRLVGALYSVDASCMEDVEWDNLLDERSGEVCHKRWNQMVLHIGQHANKSFAEQVDVLAQRYCPHLLEAREAWDSKPVSA